MITRILSVGLMAGLLAGLAVAALQHFKTTPLILQAEHFEDKAASADKHATSSTRGQARLILVHGKPHADEPTAKQAWAPKDGWERTAYTTLASVATSVGFAFILLAIMIFANEKITINSGLAWGAAAFVSAGLAPAFGIAPELPGSASAAVELRQLWWLLTATVTAAGLACVLKTSGTITRAAGIALIALPHIVGAPHPSELTSTVPAELAGQFAAASLGVQAALWALVGAGLGLFWTLGERSNPQAT